MALIETWMPPSREHWQSILWIWQLYPIFPSFQFLFSFYPMGKTSIESRFNIPGRVGWAMMEAPGFLTLLYIMWTLPAQNNISDLPAVNWLMAALFSTHYIYRALLSPLFLNPSMSPIHPVIFIAALFFQICNATCLGGWLASYGPTTTAEWEGHMLWIETGMIVFGLGLLGNMYHDDELREIRRAAARRMRTTGRAAGGSVAKVYAVPDNGLFRLVLYPHYLCEWIEWVGFWMIGGWGCVPARCFVVNEIAAMLPRAWNGKRWYVERFGKEKVGNRKAIIPWTI